MKVFLYLLIKLLLTKKNSMKEQIQQLRKELDEILTYIGSYQEERKNREVSMAYTALQRAFMWLGKCLKFIGVENPYPSSTDTSSLVIEDAVDKCVTPEDRQFDNVVECVKWLRNKVDSSISVVSTSLINLMPNNRLYHLAIVQVWISINDCKHALGLELGNIRDDGTLDKIKNIVDNPNDPASSKTPGEESETALPDETGGDNEDESVKTGSEDDSAGEGPKPEEVSQDIPQQSEQAVDVKQEEGQSIDDQQNS